MLLLKIFLTWHESIPPSANPAQIMTGLIPERELLHVDSPTIGTYGSINLNIEQHII